MGSAVLPASSVLKFFLHCKRHMFRRLSEQPRIQAIALASVAILTDRCALSFAEGRVRPAVIILLIFLLAVTLASSWGIWTIVTAAPG